MEDVELKISAIETKVGKLLDRQHSLLSKNNSLSQENEDLKALVSKQKDIVSELENKIKMLKIAKNLEQSELGNTEVKRKITEFIKDIDKCIALLNG